MLELIFAFRTFMTICLVIPAIILAIAVIVNIVESYLGCTILDWLVDKIM